MGSIFNGAIITLSDEAIIGYKDSIVRVGDNANKYLQGRVVSVSYDLPLVQTVYMATFIADNLLRSLSYPLAEIAFKANRKANRLQVGDLFAFSFSKYGISDMICRVKNLDEGPLGDESITISAKESIYHVSDRIVIDSTTTSGFTASSGSADLDGILAIVSEAGVENNITIVIVSGGTAGSEGVSFDDVTDTLTITIEDNVSTQQQIADAIETDSHIFSVTPDTPSSVWVLGVGTDTAIITGAYSEMETGIIGGIGSWYPIVSAVQTVIEHVKIIEAAYVASGDTISVFTIASRGTHETTLGYQVYMSIDTGLSYYLLENVSGFSIHGTLVAEYSSDSYQVDDIIGFEIDTTDIDVSTIEIITRTLLLTSRNLALLGDEILSFQSIVPHDTVDDRYVITGVYRGRFDTSPETHAIGTDFFFIGNTTGTLINKPEIIAGAELKFKYVPFSNTAGDISEATALSLTIEGRAKKPYIPVNLQVVDVLVNPTYTSDVVLNWTPRVRGNGTGVGIASAVTDVAPVWEGYFEIEVYVSDILVRTTSEIDAITWTYTSTMNTTDNTSLADAITFKLLNYRIVDNSKYSSGLIEIKVTKV